VAKKLYFKIGEACKLLEIQPYVLRYWETEFPFLAPDKSRSGQRVYNEGELEIIRRIKELLYEEGYTIAGAKKRLEAELNDEVPGPTGALETRPAPKNKTRRTLKATATESATSGSTPAASGAEVAELDRASQKEIEKLRAGLETALRQTREILSLLGSEAS